MVYHSDTIEMKKTETAMPSKVEFADEKKAENLQIELEKKHQQSASSHPTFASIA